MQYIGVEFECYCPSSDVLPPIKAGNYQKIDILMMGMYNWSPELYANQIWKNHH